MNPKILIKIIKIGIFALLLTPFIENKNYYFPFVGLKGIYLMALVEAVFFLWLVLVWRWPRYRPDFRNPVIFAVLIFLAVNFISAVFGANFSKSFWSTFERMAGVLMLCHLTALAIVAWSVLAKKDWRCFFYSNIFLAASMSLVALASNNDNYQKGAVIGNDSFLGVYLLVNIFIALYLFFTAEKQNRGGLLKKSKKIFTAVVFFIMVFCLFFNGTSIWQNFILKISNDGFSWIDLQKDIVLAGARADKAAFLAGIILILILWFLARNKKFGGKIIPVFNFIIFAVIIFAGIIFAIWRDDISFQQAIKRFNGGLLYDRSVVWGIAWQGFLDRPILGWGPENFDLAFAKYYNPCLGTGKCGINIWYDRAHNVVFDTLVTTGLLGLISYLAIFVAAIYILWKKYFQNIIGFPEAGVFTALLFAYFLQNLTVFDTPSSYLMFFSILGFIAFIHDSDRVDEKDYSLPATFKNIFLPLAGFVVCFYCFSLAPFFVDRNVVLAAKSLFGSVQRQELYRDALASPMGRYQIRIFFSHQWQEALADKEFIAKLSQEQIRQEFEFLTNELEKSRKDSPFDFQSRLELGGLYNSWSLFDKQKLGAAQLVLEEAQKLSTKNQQVYWELAQTKLYQLKVDEALVLARQAYDLYPNNSNAQNTLKEVEEMKIKYDEYKKTLSAPK